MKTKFIAATAVALAITAPAFANECNQMGADGINQVNAAYDKTISHYRHLQNSGAVTVRLDVDGDGPEPPQNYNVTDVIAAYENAKSQQLQEIDQGVASCNAALSETERQEKIATANLVVSPSTMFVSAAVDSALAEIGLGPNNDLRGAIRTTLNPVEPIIKVIENPEKVVKDILHKPHRILTPWKW